MRLYWNPDPKMNMVGIPSLDNGNPFHLIDHSGLGVPPMKRIEQVTPLQHGTTDRGYHMEARDIVLMLQIWGNNEEDFYNKREYATSLFRPRDAIGRLVIAMGDNLGDDDYLIEGYPVSGADFGGGNRAFLTQTIPLVIHCPDPTYYKLELKQVVFDVGGSSTEACVIPATIPMQVGSSSLDTESYVSTDGTADSYPIITITGPIADLTLTLLSSGEAIDFTGTTIAAGQQRIIDLRRGRKTVVDAAGVNKIAELAKGSDLTTFRFRAERVDRVLAFGSGVTDATSIVINWQNAFIGI